MIIITVYVTRFMLVSSLFYELFYLDSFKYYGIIIIVTVILVTVIITKKTEDLVSHIYLIINIRFGLSRLFQSCLITPACRTNHVMHNPVFAQWC